MYEEFFGFDDEPFRLTPDPRYLFLSAKHAEALAHLRLALEESSGFVCITGEVGTGKTTLLRSFLAELGPKVAAAYSFVPPGSATELLRRICRAFNLPAAGPEQGDLVEELHAYLVAQHAAGCVCVLILDEAQALSIELLEQIRLLLNLETTTHKLLRIVLVGQPQLRTLLLNPALAQLNQRITLRWHLGPLSRRETGAYVRHRLAVASRGQAAELFSEPALNLLHSVSGGVPRLINMIAQRALLAAFVSRQTRVNRRLLARAYREIQSVPLPGTLTLARKAAWAVTGLAVGVSMFVAAERGLGTRVNGDLPPPLPAAVVAGGGTDGPAALAALPAPNHAALDRTESGGVGALPAAGTENLPLRLARVDAAATFRAAANAVFAAWGEGPLSVEESLPADDLEPVAARRGLLTLNLTSNRSMLRLLDLPAVVALRIPGLDGARYVTLTSIDDRGVVLSVDGTTSLCDAEAFERLWTGQAQLVWRDFLSVRPKLQRGAQGEAVMQLQKLLRQAGVFGGEESGFYGSATENAVLAFQRAHLLQADGIVGPLTTIVLYGTTAVHPQPSLKANS